MSLQIDLSKIIQSPTRQQAISNRELVDITPFARYHDFQAPTAITAKAWERVVSHEEQEKRKERLWAVLESAWLAIKESRGGDGVHFIVKHTDEPVEMWIVAGQSSQGVHLTILLDDEVII